MLVLLKATSACNMQCDYCSEGAAVSTKHSPHLEHEVCKALVTQLVPLLKEEENVQLLWHGGEPTTLPVEHFARMHEFLSHAFMCKGHAVKGSIQTNALHLPKAWRDCLRRFDIQPGVSMDGPAFLHDTTRRSSGGEGTYAQVAKNLQTLLDEDFTPSLLCVVNQEHVQHVPEIVQWLHEWQCSVRFNPLLKCGRSDKALSGKDYYQFLQELYTESLRTELMLNMDPLSWMLEAILFDTAPTECSASGRCGERILAVHADGNVSACGRCSLHFGNILKTPLHELMNAPAWLKRRERQNFLEGTCGTCSIRQWCHGGCPEALGGYHVLPLAEDCEARRAFFTWFENDGLALLKKALIQEKSHLQTSLDALKAAQNELQHV